MDRIDIYRNGSVFTSILLDGSSSQQKQVMGENYISLAFKSSRVINFKIGDYCNVFGEKYILNRLPVVDKSSKLSYDYTVKMEAEGNDLVKAQYLFLDAANELTESDFPLTGDPQKFLDLMVENAERVSTGWKIGQIGVSGTRTISFSLDNCYTALAKIAEAFDTEYYVEGKTIHLAKKVRDTGKTFRVGSNKGLYKIVRQFVDTSSIITRLYVYGGDKNIPADYRNYSKRLRLPAAADPKLVTNVTCVVTDNGDGTQTMTFSYDAPTDPGATAVSISYSKTGLTPSWSTETGAVASPRSIRVPIGSYNIYFTTHGSFADAATAIITIEKTLVVPALYGNPLSFIESSAVNTYGVIELTEIFEEIFPHRTGTITSVINGNPYKFYDTGIDFDVNAYLLPNINAKVKFNTGQLAGYTFEVKNFNLLKREIEILRNKDEKALELPSSLFKPAIGDEYVFLDIQMPISYILNAEKDLLTKAKARLAEYAVPKASYAIEIDPVFMKRKHWGLTIGELVWIVDDELELQRKIRVTQVTRNLVNEYSYSVTVSDIVSSDPVGSLRSGQSSIRNDISTLDRQMDNNSILNNNVIGDLHMRAGSTIDFDAIPVSTNTNNLLPVYIDIISGKLVRKG